MSKAENARYYKLKGALLPSVNTVLGILDKPWKLWWLKSLISKHGSGAWDAMVAAGDRAKQIGTELHDYIYRMFNGYAGEDYTEGFTGPEIEQCMDNFVLFCHEYNPTCYLSEQVVFYGMRDKGYAGTLDFYGKVVDEGVEKWVLIDWKTSKDVHQEEYALQGEAYSRALPEECIPVDEIWIVGLPKDKKYNSKRDIAKYKPSRRRYKTFLHLLAIFHYFNPNPNPQASSIVKVASKKRRNKK